MIAMTTIRMKRGIKRDRAQIMVPTGSYRVILRSKFVFYSYRVILRSEEYYSVEMPKFLTGRNV
jgi:hypothetical protein